MRRRRRERRSLALRGTMPLLDTLFILLFTLLALSDARSTNRVEIVRVELPAVEAGAASGDAVDPERRLVLELDRESRLWLEDGERPIESAAALDRVLAARLARFLPEEVVIELRADGDARHGTALGLLQHLRLAGFVNVQIIAAGDANRDPFAARGASEAGR